MEIMFCALSQVKDFIKDLTYWNVELQEAYFSYVEASVKKEKI